ncbi:hypothetical protein CW745_00445 [Psychromonas sp. psych-6C06]|uniref:hypothetical protein n=1 Tax=Psychromonas sp. psych-6C06 TaxID=2058089 RepID=UPI000C3262F2|nr:hypothetical protein [Psychromonas sp. psych-6C06]PKF63359.1 hypothetical protein CW745_00445 [Psychromonas sp. psych-6C06]
MNKIIIAGAIVAVGAGAYILNQQQTTPAYNVLEYVPADTPVFAAQLEAFPIKKYIKSAPKIIDPTAQETIDTLYDPTQPAANFILSLIKTYEAGLADADLLVKTFGLADDVRAYFYTLGLLPVFKIEVANPQAIWDLLDKTELESGFTHKKGTLNNLSYRAYPISDETDPINAEVIVAIDNGLLTVTLNSRYNDDALLSTALGLSKAKNSLAHSGTVEEIIKQHNFKQASIGFINHVELMKGLTTKDGNQLAKQISHLEKSLGEDEVLNQIRNEQCASDFATITANWPRTVAGYTQLEVTEKESTLAVSTIVESKNATIINALAALRGFIPNYTNDFHNSVLAMAVGFDVSELANSLNTVWSDLQTPSYRCQPLAELQAQISQSGEMIGMASMGANFASGVQGVSIGLLDYSVSKIDSQPQLDNLDALFTLTAENPSQLFNSAKMFIPELQSIELSNNGTPVALNSIIPMPSELNLDPQLAIKGQHIVIYNGSKGEKVANALTSEAIAKNGLYNLSFDFKKMVTPIITAAELAGEEIPEEAMFMTEYDARMQMSIDINEQGLIFKSKINNKAP